MVAAAGNADPSGTCTGDPGLRPMPALFDDVIAVGAVDGSDRPASFSVPGAWVDVAAPGLDVRPSATGTGSSLLSGTSYAAPVVSGVAALMRERFPSLTPDQIADRIRATARHPARGRDDEVGYGVVDPAAALTAEPLLLSPGPGTVPGCRTGTSPLGSAPSPGLTPADAAAPRLSELGFAIANDHGGCWIIGGHCTRIERMFTSLDEPELEDVEDLYLDSDFGDPEPWPAIDLSLPPGARLAVQVQCAAAVPELLSRAEALDVVEGVGIMQRWLAGVRIRMLAEFTDRHPADSISAPPGADESGLVPSQRWVPDEVALTEGISRLEALGEIAQAQRFVHVLPDTLALLERGRIDLRRAEAIARATAVLPDDKARAVEAAVVPKAPDATLRQLRDRVRRAIARIDPDGEYRRHRQANTERRVSIRSLEDGMASLWFYGSAAEIEAAWQMADRLARSLDSDDPRTLDQRRFDLAMQLLQGRLAVTDQSDVDTAVTEILADRAAATGPAYRAADAEHHTDAEHHAAADHAASDHADVSAGAGEGGAGEGGVDNPRGDGGGDAGGGGDADASPAARDETRDSRNGRGAIGSAVPDDDSGQDHGDPAATTAHHDPPTGPLGTRVSPEELADAVAEALSRRPDLHATVRKPLIHVVVGIDTLLGADRPAELVGHGPIDAPTARALAADGVWRRLITDPLSGTLLDVGRTSYTPPAGLDDHVRARDQICRGPHCTRRIRDLDHHQEWAQGGDTAEPNLYGYCQHHHQLKDSAGWQVIAHDDRSLTWISPCGRRYRTEPFDYRPYTDETPDHTAATPTAPTGMVTASTDATDNEPPF